MNKNTIAIIAIVVATVLIVGTVIVFDRSKVVYEAPTPTQTQTAPQNFQSENVAIVSEKDSEIYCPLSPLNSCTKCVWDDVGLRTCEVCYWGK